jgi:hypothetical protein
MARRIRLDLFTGATGTGNSTAQDWPGGDGVFLVEASSGNVGLQIQGPGGAWINVINYATTTDLSLAAGKMGNFRAPAGPIRAAAGASTGVTCSVVGVPANTAG